MFFTVVILIFVGTILTPLAWMGATATLTSVQWSPDPMHCSRIMPREQESYGEGTLHVAMPCCHVESLSAIKAACVGKRVWGCYCLETAFLFFRWLAYDSFSVRHLHFSCGYFWGRFACKWSLGEHRMWCYCNSSPGMPLMPPYRSPYTGLCAFLCH